MKVETTKKHGWKVSGMARRIGNMSVNEYRKLHDELLGCAGEKCPITDKDIEELAFEMQDFEDLGMLSPFEQHMKMKEEN